MRWIEGSQNATGIAAASQKSEPANRVSGAVTNQNSRARHTGTSSSHPRPMLTAAFGVKTSMVTGVTMAMRTGASRSRHDSASHDPDNQPSVRLALGIPGPCTRAKS